MSEHDPRYVAARRTLLDALEALAPHAGAVIVVGAQAVYLRTGPDEEGIAPFTTDGDLALDPKLLAGEPVLEAAMEAAGFVLQDQPGVWLPAAKGDDLSVPVDLIVPEGAAAPGGRRGARLGPHGKRAAHRAVGLEAALVDHTPMLIAALDPADGRRIDANVAGVAALLMAKAHKVRDRLGSPRPGRADDKDAADVYRLMRDSSPPRVARTLRTLRRHPVAGPSVRDGGDYLLADFSRRGEGIAMAARALRLAVPAERVTALCAAYTDALAEAMDD
jgi:hypothetical protein